MSNSVAATVGGYDHPTCHAMANSLWGGNHAIYPSLAWDTLSGRAGGWAVVGFPAPALRPGITTMRNHERTVPYCTIPYHALPRHLPSLAMWPSAPLPHVGGAVPCHRHTTQLAEGGEGVATTNYGSSLVPYLLVRMCRRDMTRTEPDRTGPCANHGQDDKPMATTYDDVTTVVLVSDTLLRACVCVFVDLFVYVC